MVKAKTENLHIALSVSVSVCVCVSNEKATIVNCFYFAYIDPKVLTYAPTIYRNILCCRLLFSTLSSRGNKKRVECPRRLAWTPYYVLHTYIICIDYRLTVTVR